MQIEFIKTIKNCAMSTVDEIYTHPDEKIKQKVIEANTPALISYVKCISDLCNE